MSVVSADFWAGESTVVPSALLGYRSFRVAPGGPGQTRLASTALPHVWTETEATAVCLKGTPVGAITTDCPCVYCSEALHDPPAADCACGIYGWYRPDDTRLVSSHVFGAIEVSGRAVLATHGFRAQRARLVAVAIEPPPLLGYDLHFRDEPAPEELHAIARWCAEQGVATFMSRDDLIAEYPPHDVTSLVDHQCNESCAAWRGPSKQQAAKAAKYATLTVNAGGLASAAYALDAAARKAAAELRQAAAPAPVPPWRRRFALFGAAFMFLLSLLTVGICLNDIAFRDGVGLPTAAVAGVNAYGIYLWARLTRRAWRWGR